MRRCEFFAVLMLYELRRFRCFMLLRFCNPPGLASRLTGLVQSCPVPTMSDISALLLGTWLPSVPVDLNILVINHERPSDPLFEMKFV